MHLHNHSIFTQNNSTQQTLIFEPAKYKKLTEGKRLASVHGGTKHEALLDLARLLIE